MSELVIASRNSGKIKEIKAILKDLKLDILDTGYFKGIPRVVEDGKTLEANASKKARTISKYTKKITIADDSGLEVKMLDGRPGVKSARFAGDEGDPLKNNLKLLRLLDNVPIGKRQARFVCVMCIAKDGKVLKTVKGVCSGRISDEMKGEKGFGYDPLFIPAGYAKTFAELSQSTKNRLSHRYKALRKAKSAIEVLLRKR